VLCSYLKFTDKCLSFNAAVSSSESRALNGMWLANSELERMGKETVWPPLISRPNFYLQDPVKLRRTPLCIARVPAEIRTGNLLNISPMCYYLHQLVCYKL
jgi:hypothetical protein